MEIKIGDRVSPTNKPEFLFGALLVTEIVGENALCSYYVLDKDIKGNERPSVRIETKGWFPLKDLTIIKL
jgi:hypothetical protein